MGNIPYNLASQNIDDDFWNERIIHQNIQNASDTDLVAKRKSIMEQKRKEIQDMRYELKELREENKKLKISLDLSPSKRYKEQSSDRSEKSSKEHESLVEKDIRCDVQKYNYLKEKMANERIEYKKHVEILKNIITLSKQLIIIRENEHQQLKEKIRKMDSSNIQWKKFIEMREEYGRQLSNMRTLRQLYDEKNKILIQENKFLRLSNDEKSAIILEITKKLSDTEERTLLLEEENSRKYDLIHSLESDIGIAKAEMRQYQAELCIINQLFSHVLVAFNNAAEPDLDKLLKQLEDNHDLLRDIINNEACESSALPKVLLDLVNDISLKQNKEEEESVEESYQKISDLQGNTFPYDLNSPTKIAENLPKVWKILLELLSHQSSRFKRNEMNKDNFTCYKNDITKGTNVVLSVSKTFIRLKDLIIEKKSLEKDMNHLKQLNIHLECKIQDQEQRFELVTAELSRTWNFVKELQKEHRLLHTQEKILRYELAQKRKLLDDLKRELEYSRQKWQEAKEKNFKTEEEFSILRKEIDSREKINNGEKQKVHDYAFHEESDTVNIEFREFDENSVLSENHCLEPTNCEDENDSLNLEGYHENEIFLQFETQKILSVPVLMDNTLIDVNIRESQESRSTDEIKNSIVQELECPASSSTSTSTSEELDERERRLRKLEHQCKSLLSQVTKTAAKSEAINSKLDILHETYGENSSSNEDEVDVEASENDPKL